MNKVILFDVDGVILNTKMFSERYTAEYGIDLSVMLPFFKGPFRDCQLGNADLYTELDKVKDDWGFTGETSELIEYWFSDIIPGIDKRLISSVVKLRDNENKCYIATNQEANRAEYLWEDAGLSSYFDGIFASYEMGVKKPEKEYFEYIINKQKVSPTEIIFFDSDPEIVEASNNFGIEAYLYTDYDGLEKKLADLDI
jgi:putative hydrolase of the HAD superfamily